MSSMASSPLPSSEEVPQGVEVKAEEDSFVDRTGMIEKEAEPAVLEQVITTTMSVLTGAGSLLFSGLTTATTSLVGLGYQYFAGAEEKKEDGEAKKGDEWEMVDEVDES